MDSNAGVSIEQIGSEISFNITERDMKELEDMRNIVDDYLGKENMFEMVTEILIIAFYSLFMMTGVVANVVIILVIVFNKKLKTTNHMLLINLFVSDLLLCVFCMPFTLLALIRRSWYFGQLLCKLIPFIQAVAIFVSAATITSIAIDRLSQITNNKIIGKVNLLI